MNFKKIVWVLIFCITATTESVAQGTIDPDRFKSSVMQFLREEGFSPSIDEDGDVAFKKEGRLHWIATGTGNPLYVEFHRLGYSTENTDYSAWLKAVNYGNMKIPSAKAILKEKSVAFVVEMFCHSVEEFKFIFYKCLNSLENMQDVVQESYNENKGGSVSSAPFSYVSADVANVDYDGNYINNYGDNIYSGRTRYLKPRITLNVKQEGTYDIYVKMFNPSGTLATGSSSPSGYSYSTSINMTTGSHSYMLKGWGSNTDGHWSAGSYRFEFYYNGELLGTKYFTVN